MNKTTKIGSASPLLSLALASALSVAALSFVAVGSADARSGVHTPERSVTYYHVNTCSRAHNINRGRMRDMARHHCRNGSGHSSSGSNVLRDTNYDKVRCQRHYIEGQVNRVDVTGEFSYQCRL